METDIEYLRHPNLTLQARLYRPAGNGPFPAIVDVHGGAWTSSDRFGNAPIDRHLAANGIVVLALDFRMPPVAKYPAQIADVNAGIRYLKAHAAEFGSRPELVGGLGTSSGGHVIMVNALRPADPTFAAIPVAGDHSAELAYVVACWPIVDPLARYRMAKAKHNALLVTAHDAFWADEAEMEAGSATGVLERGEATHLPPALIAIGTADENVTPDMAPRFADAYRRAGGELRLDLYDGQPHTFVKTDLESEAARRALASIVEFVHEHAAARR
jgi:acetyl esterase/lipase